MTSPSADDKRLAEIREWALDDDYTPRPMSDVTLLLRLLDASQARLAQEQAQLKRLQDYVRTVEGYVTRAEAAEAQITKLEQEINRRKGDPVTRLHNICEAVEDPGPFSKEAWDRLEHENEDLQVRLVSATNHKQAAEGRASALAAALTSIASQVNWTVVPIDSDGANTAVRIIGEMQRIAREALSQAAVTAVSGEPHRGDG